MGEKFSKGMTKGKTLPKKSHEHYLMNSNSSFRMLEAYNTLRTNIMFSLTKAEKNKAILITSSAQNEGKTTISINMAISFAQFGAKVLLIDADLRRPSIHRYLKLDGRVGLSNLLCGYADLDDSIQRGAVQNVDIITAGEIPPNPTKLLASQELRDLLDALEEQYDYIFIDTPPTSVVTDSVLIANSCAGVVVVVRENFTEFDRLDMAVKSLKKADANLLGFVMLANEKGRGKKYGYYGDYGYGSPKTPTQKSKDSTQKE